MPPKPKYTKEQIVGAALDIVSEKGLDALTAKEVALALNTSTTPIFTVFASMRDLTSAVRFAAMEKFERYAHKSENDMPPFKQIGMQMIAFAKEEPRLYKLLFMSPSSDVRSFDDIYSRLGNVADESIGAIMHDYGLNADAARLLFEHVWIHTYGIGALCSSGMCDMSKEQISEMLTQDFTAIMMLLKLNTEDLT